MPDMTSSSKCLWNCQHAIAIVEWSSYSINIKYTTLHNENVMVSNVDQLHYLYMTMLLVAIIS